MTDNEENQPADGPPAAHQEAPEAMPAAGRPWWAIPAALAGAFIVKYLARRGAEETPRQTPPPAPGQPESPEVVKDADFEVIE